MNRGRNFPLSTWNVRHINTKEMQQFGSRHNGVWSGLSSFDGEKKYFISSCWDVCIIYFYLWFAFKTFHCRNFAIQVRTSQIKECTLWQRNTTKLTSATFNEIIKARQTIGSLHCIPRLLAVPCESSLTAWQVEQLNTKSTEGAALEVKKCVDKIKREVYILLSLVA